MAAGSVSKWGGGGPRQRGVRALWPHRGDLEETVSALGDVLQPRDPAKLAVELVQKAGGVEHLSLEGAEQLIIVAGEAVGQAQRVLQLFPQLALGRVRLPAVWGRGGLEVGGRQEVPGLPCPSPRRIPPAGSPTLRISRHFSHSSRICRQPAELRRISRHTMRSSLKLRDSAERSAQPQHPKILQVP